MSYLAKPKIKIAGVKKNKLVPATPETKARATNDE